MERIGIMGGMFDPVHIGHIRIAIAAQQALRLDQIRLIPCGIPNHRDRALCSPLQRLEMLQLAIADHQGMVIDDRELKRQGTSYTYDTLLSLRGEFEQSSLCFILGIDAFATLENWHRWRDLFALCHFVVIERAGYSGTLSDKLAKELRGRRTENIGELLDKKSGAILDMKGIDSPVSSSMVREHIARKDSLHELLDPAVAGYLRENKLYL